MSREECKNLRRAINARDFLTAKSLLDRGVDPDDSNLRGNTALHRAVIGGWPDMVDLVLRYRPSLQVRNIDNHTPADLAAHMGYRDLLEKLGAPVNPKYRPLF